MTDTQWADISNYQVTCNDAYPYRVLSFRSNDGTYRDTHFLANIDWCESAIARGRLDFYIVYAVYEPDNEAWARTLISMVGTPHPRLVVMIDLESWGGRISGDHSADINRGRAELAQWLGSSARVIGYGNGGDLSRIWPNRGDARIVLANYSSNPSFPGKIAHQFTSSATVAPFGHPVDMNSADGLDVGTLMGVLGLTGTPADVNVNPFDPNNIPPVIIPPIQGGNMFLVYDAQAAKANGQTAGAGDTIQWILATVDGGQIRLLYLEDPAIRAVVLSARGDKAPWGIPIAGCDTATWNAFLAKEGYAYGKPVPLIDVNASGVQVALSDAQLQAIEQGVSSSVSAALVAAGVSIPQAQVDAIAAASATAVRATFTTEPLK